MLDLKNKNKIIKWLLIIAAIFFVLVLLLYAVCVSFEIKYRNKIYPGISIGEMDFSGLGKEQAVFLLNKKINYINSNGVDFSYSDNHVIISPLVASMESDLAYEIINFNSEKTVDLLLKLGRGENFYENMKQKLLFLFGSKNFNILFNINEEAAKKILIERFSEYETPARDAKLIYSENNDAYSFSVEKETAGETIDYEKSLLELKNKLAKLDNSPILLKSKKSQPEIHEKDCLNIESKSQAILNKAPLTLKYLDKEWIIEKKELIDLLGLKVNAKFDSSDKIIVGLDFKLASDYLASTTALEINIEPIDAKFEINDGRVAEFQASQDGLELNIPKNIELIENKLFSPEKFENIELIVDITKSDIKTESINDLGIKEIIGIGKSNFAGSPVNRRHNIKVGADSLNGILIKPNEEFSLLKALGEINGETGYRTELVIKDNKTIPEFGGGLCQIGTTAFRAALASGLPITMRRNHSYRVVYYEPAGTDATIYDPWPDFKFVNDTPNHIVIQTRIEGDNLYFDFWGTKDGRIVEKTDPEIYNIVKPGPTKMIETLDLKPEEKKCTESAHNGADAHFNYKVTYADGKIEEKKFTSHYVPWQAVCLLGVEKLTEKTEETPIATSTEKKIE